jgi:NitT/TauT family transport system substrate-binding protein
MKIGRRGALALLAGAAAATGPFGRVAAAPPADGVPTVRIGILQFGSVAWQLDVIRRHDLERAEGVRVDVVSLASNQATLVALQAGAVDVVVSDLLWVARQRAAGADWGFLPYSSALGAVEVPAASPIQSFEQLAGRRLGIAGTPLDKSWLLLRLLARRRLGRDLDETVDKVFGAPPLLSEELAAGRIDAALTYWQFAARLEARGMRRLIGMGEAMRELGIAEPVPLVGYVLSERWAREHARDCGAFLRAFRRAEEILLRSDDEWQTIAAMTGAESPAELARLRDAFREGAPRRPDPALRPAAEALYGLFADIGGEALVGPSRTLPEGTFLDGIDS